MFVYTNEAVTNNSPRLVYNLNLYKSTKSNNHMQDTIVTPEIEQKLLRAGKVAAQVRREGAKKLAVPGASFLEVMDFCESRIKELGAEIAWAQLALNDVAAHECPAQDDKKVSKAGDIIKIDIGTHIDGYIADNAMTVQVETDKYNDLIKASQNALKAAIKLVEPGRELWEIGEAQYSEAEKFGFTTIKNLCGHSLGRHRVHAGVSIPTFNNKDRTQLKKGWQIAIEPFVTPGDGFVVNKGQATVWMMNHLKGVRSPFARKIIDEVKPLNGLPFTNRWITRKFGMGATKLGLRELNRLGIITGYPPLAERTGKMVSQFEHSMIIKDKAKVYTRHSDDTW